MKGYLRFVLGVAMAGGVVAWVMGADGRAAGPPNGSALVIHRADVVKDRGTNSGGAMRLWPLLSTPEARMNYIEVTGKSGAHFHPDADHRLYVIEGAVVVITGTNRVVASVGDLIVIPKGVPHAYDVPNQGDRALLLTFDAPPYDPKKTVPVEKGAVKP